MGGFDIERGIDPLQHTMSKSSVHMYVRNSEARTQAKLASPFPRLASGQWLLNN